MMEKIDAEVKKFILAEFLDGEDPEELTGSTPLITGGILDSIAIIKLVAFLEEQYNIEVKPQEVDVSYLGTISDIGEFVRGKLGEAS